MNMVTYLVTGGSGFVGRALVEKLLEDDAARVVATSRAGPNGKRPRLDNKRVDALSESTDWTDALKDVDVVFHCAAETSGKRSDPANLMAANRDGTFALARRAATVGVTRFVFLSTAQVHGVSTHGKRYNEMSPPNPQSPYAVSKWEAESGLLEIAKETGLAVTIVRPPLVYGPGVKGNLAQLAKLATLGVPLPFASVANRRSLVALDNLVDFLCYSAHHAAASNETYLVSDGQDLSTGQIMRHVAGGRRVRLFPFPIAPMQALLKMAGRGGIAERLLGSFQIDGSKARKQTGWVPVVTPDTAHWI